ncbi:hypothetical protein GCM10007049_00330 [Echinicola pacifica]|uniref:Outer membrane protein TolC n=1 Tax=Echinicola pacifica TaxID=346377 RepID=A0A918PK45_9BACT|nr:TolC family protein [Echinicola pacifica]GGZ12574.1 hypothetical protein GCM10007049_00330 [Echinicola pacifica]
MRRNSVLYLLIFGWMLMAVPREIQAQEGVDPLVLTFGEYIHEVIHHHPLSAKARLNRQKAEANLRAARGGFDPVLSAGMDQKQYQDKMYYRKEKAELRIPTVAGIEVVGGYENNQGYYLNPENQTGDNGLWNAGIEVNILQGLLVDERRTALRQAKTYAQLAEQQQILQTNELYYEAAKVYLYWANSHKNLEVVEESTQLAQQYFLNTKESYINGEKTAMDTLEAFTMWQDRQNLLVAAEGNLIAQKANLENYFWQKEEVILEPQYQPQAEIDYHTVPIQAAAIPADFSANPQLLASQYEIETLETGRLLKQQKLWPKLKLKYMPLLSPTGDGLPTYNQNDYKWGFGFQLPLFLRAGRGDLLLSQIKIQEKQLDLETKTLVLENKIINSKAQISYLEDQVNNQRQNVSSYQKLLEGEIEKFNYGESSVFLVNKRQEKYLEGQIKLTELRTKVEVEKLSYLYYINQLPIPE